MFQILLIALFGAVGAVGRYSISGLVYRGLGESFPYGTLVVNLLGCFLLGLVIHIGQTTDWILPMYRQALTIGTLGALTTFSTFSYETLMQFEAGQWQSGMINVASNVCLGLIFAWMGLVAGGYLVGGV